MRARFWVQKITKHCVSQGNTNLEVTLQPVIRSGGEGADGNTDWSKYTPSGEIRMTVTTEEASRWWESRLGQDIGITFADPE